MGQQHNFDLFRHCHCSVPGHYGHKPETTTKIINMIPDNLFINISLSL